MFVFCKRNGSIWKFPGTARQDTKRICDLECSLEQWQILNPLSEARDWTCDLMDARQICFCWATMELQSEENQHPQHTPSSNSWTKTLSIVLHLRDLYPKAPPFRLGPRLSMTIDCFSLVWVEPTWELGLACHCIQWADCPFLFYLLPVGCPKGGVMSFPTSTDSPGCHCSNLSKQVFRIVLSKSSEPMFKSAS